MQSPSISIAPLGDEARGEVGGDAGMLSPSVKSSRRSAAGGSIKSKRKTSVDTRYEAQAELNDI